MKNNLLHRVLLTGVLACTSFITKAQQVNYQLVCVDSVWYDTTNPILINVRLFNGDVNHLNYPSVQIIGQANDTISNPNNFVNYFAHLGGAYQTYTDTITVFGIPDFSNFTFLLNELFGDTSGIISFCGTVGINELNQNKMMVYPNPAKDKLNIATGNPGANLTIEIYDVYGIKVMEDLFQTGLLLTLDVADLKSGLYTVMIRDGEKASLAKFIKQ